MNTEHENLPLNFKEQFVKSGGVIDNYRDYTITILGESISIWKEGRFWGPYGNHTIDEAREFITLGMLLPENSREYSHRESAPMEVPEKVKEEVTSVVESRLSNLREALAELEHDKWVEWSKAIAEKEQVSPERLERWKGCWVPYAELSEEKKEIDRMYADRVLQILSNPPQPKETPAVIEKVEGVVVVSSKEGGTLEQAVEILEKFLSKEVGPEELEVALDIIVENDVDGSHVEQAIEATVEGHRGAASMHVQEALVELDKIIEQKLEKLL